MARKRQIDPDIWLDDKVAQISLLAELFYIGLISHADDDGRLKWSALQLKGRIYPTRDDVTLAQVEGWMQEVAEARLVRVYEFRGAVYACHPSWRTYQYVSKPTPSKLPAPPSEADEPVFRESSGSTPTALVLELVMGTESLPVPTTESHIDLTPQSAPNGAEREKTPPGERNEAPRARLRPVADAGPTFEGDLETETAAFIAFCAESNKTGTIAVSRAGNIRREIAKRLDEFSLAAVLYGLREAIRLDHPAIEYAIAVARNYRPGKAAYAGRAAPERSPAAWQLEFAESAARRMAERLEAARAQSANAERACT